MTLLTETSSDKASASSYDKGTSEYLPSLSEFRFRCHPKSVNKYSNHLIEYIDKREIIAVHQTNMSSACSSAIDPEKVSLLLLSFTRSHVAALTTANPLPRASLLFRV